MTEPTKDQQATTAATMASGIRKHFTSLPTMYIDGTPTPPAEAATKLDSLAQLRFDVDHAKAEYEAALDKANAHEAETTAYVAGVRAFVRSAVGNDPAVLIDFGIPPLKPKTPQTVDAKAAAIAKRESTRKARGTMGSRQRAEIHGDVTGVEITPVESPATPATATKAAASTAPKSTASPAEVTPGK
jgi:hypothetical protein